MHGSESYYKSQSCTEEYTSRSYNQWFGRKAMKSGAPQKFFRACSTGDIDAVAAFLKEGIHPDSRDKYHLTGLIWAGRKGHVAVAQLLIARGAGIDVTDVTGRTAFFHAVTFKRYDFVEFLAARGAKISPVDMHGWTPLDFSRVSRHLKMVALLDRCGAVGKYTQAEPAHAA